MRAAPDQGPSDPCEAGGDVGVEGAVCGRSGQAEDEDQGGGRTRVEALIGTRKELRVRSLIKLPLGTILFSSVTLLRLRVTLLRLRVTLLRLRVTLPGVVLVLVRHPEPGATRVASLCVPPAGLQSPQGPRGRAPAGQGPGRVHEGVESARRSPGVQGGEGPRCQGTHGSSPAGKRAAELARCVGVCAVEPSRGLPGAGNTGPGDGQGKGRGRAEGVEGGWAREGTGT